MKLDLRDRVQAVIFAYETGMMAPRAPRVQPLSHAVASAASARSTPGHRAPRRPLA
jgi:hypothetical protein